MDEIRPYLVGMVIALFLLLLQAEGRAKREGTYGPLSEFKRDMFALVGVDEKER